jgi:hypothetical protein
MQRKSEMLADWLIDLRSDLLRLVRACMHRSGEESEEQIAPAGACWQCGGAAGRVAHRASPCVAGHERPRTPTLPRLRRAPLVEGGGGRRRRLLDVRARP